MITSGRFMDNDKVEDSAPQKPAGEEMESYQPINQQNPGKKKFLVTVGLIIVLLVVGYFTISMLLGTNKSTVQEDTKTEQSPTPVPTPSVTLDKSEWVLEVVNGSGVSGLAKKVADQLKELGYQVVKVGNADRSDYSESQIMVKGELMDKVNLFIVDVKDVIKIASVGGQLKDSTASARIILGKQ